MKKIASIVAAGICTFALSGAANALSFTEAQGTTFQQYLDVTPTVTNKMLFSISGFNSSFDSLGFSFVGNTGPSVTATNTLNPSVKLASFNDFKNNSFSLTAGTHYFILVSGVTHASIPGGVGSLSISALNATVTPTTLSNVIASVPEPETYAMFLAGLGLIGGIARRRKGKGSI